MSLDLTLADREPNQIVAIADGIVVADKDGIAINVAGTVFKPPTIGRWTLTPGQPVRVLVAGPHLEVLGPITPPRPAKGRVIAFTAGSASVTVETNVGQITCERIASYSPAIGDTVALLWQQDPPIVIGTVTVRPPQPGEPGYLPPTPPAPSPTAGTARCDAIDSGSWTSSGGWNNTMGSHVMQGAWKGMACQGIWLYGGAPSALRGRTVTGLRLFIGPRRHVGSYNVPLQFAVILHPHTTRPGGALSVLDRRLSDPVPDGAWATVHLPPNWGQAIVDGTASLGLADGTYGGATGIKDGSPGCGRIEIDWRS